MNKRKEKKDFQRILKIICIGLMDINSNFVGKCFKSTEVVMEVKLMQLKILSDLYIMCSAHVNTEHFLPNVRVVAQR